MVNLHNRAPPPAEVYRAVWAYLSAMDIPNDFFNCGDADADPVWVMDACTCGTKKQSGAQRASANEMQTQEERIIDELYNLHGAQGTFTSRGLHLCRFVTTPALKGFRTSSRSAFKELGQILHGCLLLEAAHNLSRNVRRSTFTTALQDRVQNVADSIKALQRALSEQETMRSICKLQPLFTWVLDSAFKCTEYIQVAVPAATTQPIAQPGMVFLANHWFQSKTVHSGSLQLMHGTISLCSWTIA